MTTCPRIPRVGEKISATWMAELVRFIKSLRVLKGPGINIEYGPNGTIIRASQDAVKRSSTTLNGCFRIKSIVLNKETSAYTIKFDNTYYQIGGKTYKMDEDSAFITTQDMGGYICLAIDAQSTDSEPSVYLYYYHTMDELNEDQASPDYLITPLYEVDENAAIKCDFRIGPHIVMGEY